MMRNAPFKPFVPLEWCFSPFLLEKAVSQRWSPLISHHLFVVDCTDLSYAEFILVSSWNGISVSVHVNELGGKNAQRVLHPDPHNSMAQPWNHQQASGQKVTEAFNTFLFLYLTVHVAKKKPIVHLLEMFILKKNGEWLKRRMFLKDHGKGRLFRSNNILTICMGAQGETQSRVLPGMTSKSQEIFRLYLGTTSKIFLLSPTYRSSEDKCRHLDHWWCQGGVKMSFSDDSKKKIEAGWCLWTGPEGALQLLVNHNVQFP